MIPETQRTHSPDKLRAPTVDSEGKRRWIYPERRSGARARKRALLAYVLMAVYLIVPFVSIRGLPLLRFDVMNNLIFIGGQTFRFTDGFYLVFLFVCAGLLLAWVTSLWGRVWCGYGCPQTVFTDWLIRPIEELCEGPALKRRKNDEAPWTAQWLLRKTAKHGLFVALLLVISHAFLAYFVEPAQLLAWVKSSPSEHPKAFLGMGLVFSGLYFDLVWFREQFCSFLCPYARFQSLLIGPETPTIAFDYKRGEPRGKKLGSGDCIDCGLCVRVCPTGIDIRNGLQLECIQCARCGDACDSVMQNLKRPLGLIRFASEWELQTQEKPTKKRVRPLVYALLFVLTFSVFAISLIQRDDLSLTVVRQPSTTFVELAPDRVANYYTLRVVNRKTMAQTLEFETMEGVELICSLCRNPLSPNQEASGSLVVIFDPKKIGKEISLKAKGIQVGLDLPLISR